MFRKINQNAIFAYSVLHEFFLLLRILITNSISQLPVVIDFIIGLKQIRISFLNKIFIKNAFRSASVILLIFPNSEPVN